MPQPLPNLDDRRWADLVEEGRALIPVYAPEWTDHNVHDPGITFLELLAGVTEMDMFQLNRIPDRHKRKFLALAGFDVRGPQPAHTVLAFALKKGSGPLALPAGTALATRDGDNEEIPFRLLEAVNVVS